MVPATSLAHWPCDFVTLAYFFAMTQTDMPPFISLRGARVYKDLLSEAVQRAMLDDLRDVVRAAPLIAPRTRSGQMSVRMTSAGAYGWVSEAGQYRYAERHPNGAAWPAIPASIRAVWDLVAAHPRAPQSCLVNYYGEGAKMGLHQDRDEADFSAPVVSISLGDQALFRMGNTTRGGKTESIWLSSGDVVVLGGDARLRYHGIDRIKFGSSRLTTGRVNVTLRVVT